MATHFATKHGYSTRRTLEEFSKQDQLRTRLGEDAHSPYTVTNALNSLTQRDYTAGDIQTTLSLAGVLVDTTALGVYMQQRYWVPHSRLPKVIELLNAPVSVAQLEAAIRDDLETRVRDIAADRRH